MDHRKLGIQEMARNRPAPRGEHEPRVGHYDWKATDARDVPVWILGEEDKQAEARRRTPQAPAPSRGRLAHCVRRKQSGSPAGRGWHRRGYRYSKKAKRYWRLLRVAKDRIQGDTRSFGKGDQPEHIQLSCRDVTRAK